jgi:hypothetical protein
MLTHGQRSGFLLLASSLLATTGWLTFTSASHAQDNEGLAKLIYTKTLKGSVPEYLQITVDSNGSGTYDGRKLDEPANPRPLHLASVTSQRLFELAEELGNFRSVDLESHKRVANLGLKTLTFQRGSEVHRVEFNYTQNRVAQELVDWMERIASVEQHISTLEYAIKYDHLSLPGELLQIQIDLDNRALADPELMVPELEAIVRNPRFLHLAQTRAQNILQRIQASN